MSKLKAYGIFAFAAVPAGALPKWRSMHLGGIPVKVRAFDYEAARALIRDVEPSPRKRLSGMARSLPALGVIVVAAVMAALIVRDRMGLSNAAFGGLYLVLPLVCGVLAAEAIRVRRQWWTLILAPIPIVLALDLFSL